MLHDSLESICELLLSNKIRDRNEALERLQDINFNLPSTINLISPELVIKVVNCLDVFLNSDIIIYEKSNANSVVEARLNKASSILKLIIIHVWGNPKFASLYKPRQSEKLVEILIKHFTYQPFDEATQVCEPVVLNMTKALNFLLEIQCFKDHMFSNTHELILDKSLICLNMILSDSYNSSKNENFTIELLSLIYQFICPRNTSDLRILKNDHKDYYTRTFNFCLLYFKNVFSKNKRERESMIFIFRMINKCIISSSTENVKSSHQFYKLGVQFILEVKAITSLRFVSEIALFINIIPPFINLNDLQKLEGDNWDMDLCGELTSKTVPTAVSKLDRSESSSIFSAAVKASSEAEDSVVLSDSQGSDDENISRKRMHPESSDFDSNIINLGKLFEIVFSLLNDSTFRRQLDLENDSVKFRLNPVKKEQTNLFSFEYLYLKNDNSPTPWLSRLGLCRILVSFYSLCSEANSFVKIKTKRFQGESVHLGDSFQLSEYLLYFDDATSFFLSIIIDDPYRDSNNLLVISQMFTLFLAYIPSSHNELHSNHIIEDFSKNENEILSQIINAFEKHNSNVNFWLFYAATVFYTVCYTYNTSKGIAAERITEHNDFEKMMKYSLEFLKEPLMSKIACNFLSIVSLFHFQLNSSKLSLSKSLLQQYQNVIELSEINGPPQINEESMFFWITSSLVCKNYNFANAKLFISSNNDEINLFSYRVSNWLISRLDSLNNLTLLDDVLDAIRFVKWLLGSTVVFFGDETILNDDSYKGDQYIFFETIKSNVKVSSYILQKNFTDTEDYSINFKNIPGTKLSTNSETKTRIQDSFSRFIDKTFTLNDHTWLKWTICVNNLFEKDNNMLPCRSWCNMLVDRLKSFKDMKELSIMLHIYYDSMLMFRSANLIHAISQSEIVELTLYLLNSDDGSKRSTEAVDIFDSFIGSNLNNLTERFADYYKYRSPSLKLTCSKLEQKAMKFFLYLYDFSTTKSIEFAVSFSSRIKSKFQFLATQYELMKFFDNKTPESSDSILDQSYNHITLLLEAHDTKMFEASLVIICDLFDRFSHIWSKSNIGIEADGKALYDFLANIDSRNMLHTVDSAVAFFKFMSKLLLHASHLDIGLSTDKLHENIIGNFGSFRNLEKFIVAPQIKDYIKARSIEQIEIYSAFVGSFSSPQQAIEKSAMFCYFMVIISQSSESSIIACTCNLSQLSQFNQIKAYLKSAIISIAVMNGIKDVHSLFWNFKEVFLRCWEGFGTPITHFPYTLFGFNSLAHFYRKNYKEIIGLSLAYNKLDNISVLAKSLSMKELSLINDSMASSITFSWTKGGARNKVFKFLETYYKSPKMLKTNIKEQLILIIYNLLRYCDCSMENDLISVFESSADDKDLLFTRNTSKVVFLEEYEMYIKPKSCVDMIKYFADTCGLNEIWTSPLLYHLVSKVLLLIENSIFKNEKLLHVRRLKLLIIMGADALTDSNVCELIVTNISPLLKTSYLINEVAPIIKLILKTHSLAPSRLTTRTCFISLDTLLHLDRNEVSLQIAMSLEKVNFTEQLKEYYQVYIYALKSYTKRSFNTDIDLHSFITRASLESSETAVAIKLLSSLFEKNPTFEGLVLTKANFSLSAEHIQNLYNIKLNFGSLLSGSMSNWIGKCSAIYYQHTGKCPKSEKCEYDTYLLKNSSYIDFNNEMKSLNMLFIKMINDTKSCSLKQKYCFETIVGVIINRQRVQMENLALVLSYDDLFLAMESYIQPIGNYLCSLLIDQVEDETLAYYKSTLDQVSNGFTTSINAYKFKDWMSQISFSLINELSSQTPIILLLATYLCHIPEFAIKCFCPLILYYVENQPSKRSQNISKMIQEFFKQDFRSHEREAVEIFVELVLSIRLGNKTANDKFISLLSNVDMMLVIEAALYIKKFKTALMSYEDYIAKKGDNTSDILFSNPNDLDRLKTIYSGLEDRDLNSGLPTIPELEYGVLNLRVNSRWGEMMFNNAIFDTCLKKGDNNMLKSINEVSHGMMNMGWAGASNIISEYSRNKISSHLNDDDQLYEQLWKLSQWDIPTVNEPKSENKSIYSMLKNIKDDLELNKEYSNTLAINLLQLDTEKFGRIDDTSTEKLESWMRTLTICFCINEMVSSDEELCLNFDNFVSSTEWFNNATCAEFENILLSRYALLESIGSTQKLQPNDNFMSKRKGCWSAAVKELHRYNSLMISKNQIQKSINASVMLDHISKSVFELKEPGIERIAKFNLARSFWIEKSDTRFPIDTLKDIIENDISSQQKAVTLSSSEIKNSSFGISTNYLLATLTQWCEESKQETSTTLMEKYVSKIVEGFEKNPGLNKERDTGLTYHIIAKFCDDQILQNQNNSLGQNLSHSITLLDQDIASLTKFVKEENLDNEKKKYAIQDLNRLKMRHKTQSKELTLLKKERNNYVVKAISFYFKSIAFRNHNFIETDIDRFCSLWIEHNDITLNEADLLGLPTSNFVPWSNQLVSRLLDEKSTFQGLLKNLIINIAYSHPFHILYSLKSLRLIKKESDDNAAVSRGTVAEQIWEILLDSPEKFNVEGFHDIVQSIDSFADKSVDIANIKSKNSKKISLQKLPQGKWWRNDLPGIALPSPVKSIEIRENRPYRASELPIMLRVSDNIVTASSGVSHPKIMKFSLSTGETQKMLMKAPDDLRQDSIMKQVFEKVNRLLRQDIETRKRNSRIVTYNVLPLGPTSGILEFVPNSMPLVDILKLLHKHDLMDINEARMKMKEVQTQSKSVRYQTYKEICKKIKPCLKDFFFNNFTLPDAWFNSRTLYCHGIATTSITGYILGIGDRHCNNILLDKSSGEPIHIDFGIAFDQGKLLPIPETVPFRLTRDIVDGMGVTKVNGMFSKSCEHVMRVLRTNTQYIASILDVLKYDPLYSWTLSPLRKKKLQQIYFNDDENNITGIEEFVKADIGSEANTAIETVKKKLEAKGLSDEAVVRELIREAVDPKNLCLIFMGWSPFL